MAIKTGMTFPYHRQENIIRIKVQTNRWWGCSIIFTIRLERGPISIGKTSELDLINRVIVTADMPISATNIKWPILWEVLSNGFIKLTTSGCKSNGANKSSLDNGMKNHTPSAIKTERENEIFEAVSLDICVWYSNLLLRLKKYSAY